MPPDASHDMSNRHAGPDPAASFAPWIPAFAGMTSLDKTSETSTDSKHEIIPVEISIAAVPSHLNGATYHGVLWKAAPDRFLLDVPDVARYLVEDGRRITIDPSPTASETDLGRFLRMTPLAALLFQRGIMAFHSAAVSCEKGTVLIAGDSGAGKSTLIAAMLKRGWCLLADDLAAVDLNERGIPVVFPHSPEVILWSDAMEKLEIGHNAKGRHFLPVDYRFIASPQPLTAIFRVAVHKDRLECSAVEGTKVFNTFTSISYNSRIADALFDRSAFMRGASAIAGKVPVYTLKRPRGEWTINELADHMEKRL